MPINIQGRKPISPRGKQFPSESQSWQPIHSLMGQLCRDLFDEKALRGMAAGDGSGPVDQKTCNEIAARFQHWMAHHSEGLALDAGIRAMPEGRFPAERQMAANPARETLTPYLAQHEQMRKWIEFLRHCGGFEVR